VTAAPEYTRQATAAITQAARSEHDFAGWLAQVLAAAAGQLGSSDAMIKGRPGSWEASFVDQLVKGTVGYDDKYLPGPAGGRKLTDAKAREIRWRYDDGGEVTQRELAAEFGVSVSTVSDIVTGKTWGGWHERRSGRAGRAPRAGGHDRCHPACPGRCR